MNAKKFLTCFLSTALIMTSLLSIPTNAEAANSEITENNGSASQNVTFSVGQPDSATLYSVDVIWTDVYFKYTAKGQAWNPGTHSYEGSEDSFWADNSASVKITNHSNSEVKITVDFELPSPQNGTATVNVSNPSFTLPTAIGTEFSNAPTTTSELTASGVPVSNAMIGTVKVTVATS